jgi:murein tripeptide amidase MpaA
VHGDEALPFAFIAGAEGCACWGPRIRALQAAFVASYGRANPDMQRTYGYEADTPLGANLAICSNQIAQRFDCLAVRGLPQPTDTQPRPRPRLEHATATATATARPAHRDSPLTRPPRR